MVPPFQDTPHPLLNHDPDAWMLSYSVLYRCGKHHSQSQLWKKGFISAYCFYPIREESKIRSSRQEPGGRNKSEDPEETLPAGSLLVDCSSQLLTQARTTAPGGKAHMVRILPLRPSINQENACFQHNVTESLSQLRLPLPLACVKLTRKLARTEAN